MASNSFSVSVPALDFTRQGAPTTQSYHGVSILIGGATVGRIQSWQVQVYKRTVTLVRELNSRTFGRPVDAVPSIADGYTASGQRFEVWGEELEKACGYPQVFEDLIDQTFPFAVKEMWFKGTTIYRITDFLGCWFTDADIDQWEATGDAIVKRAFTLTYVSHRISLGR